MPIRLPKTIKTLLALLLLCALAKWSGVFAPTVRGRTVSQHLAENRGLQPVDTVVSAFGMKAIPYLAGEIESQASLESLLKDVRFPMRRSSFLYPWYSERYLNANGAANWLLRLQSMGFPVSQTLAQRRDPRPLRMFLWISDTNFVIQSSEQTTNHHLAEVATEVLEDMFPLTNAWVVGETLKRDLTKSDK
jgi:hypothetical protein